MDAELQKFLRVLEENTREQRMLRESIEKQTSKIETIIEMTDTALRGDPKLKIKPLVILFAEMNHLLSLIGPDLRFIAAKLNNMTKVPKLVELAADLFKKGR